MLDALTSPGTHCRRCTLWLDTTRTSNLVEKNIAQRQSASRYLKELAAIGVLREVQAGKEKLFIHPKLMQLLADDRNAFTPYQGDQAIR